MNIITFEWLTAGVTAILAAFGDVAALVTTEPILALFASGSILFLVIAMVKRLMSA